jgi:hypothetical protein
MHCVKPNGYSNGKGWTKRFKNGEYICIFNLDLDVRLLINVPNKNILTELVHFANKVSLWIAGDDGDLNLDAMKVLLFFTYRICTSI